MFADFKRDMEGRSGDVMSPIIPDTQININRKQSTSVVALEKKVSIYG